MIVFLRILISHIDLLIYRTIEYNKIAIVAFFTSFMIIVDAPLFLLAIDGSPNSWFPASFIGIKAIIPLLYWVSCQVLEWKQLRCVAHVGAFISSEESHWKLSAVAFKESSVLFDSSSILFQTANLDKLILEMFFIRECRIWNRPPSFSLFYYFLLLKGFVLIAVISEAT
jgi:hypothetical protein